MILSVNLNVSFYFLSIFIVCAVVFISSKQFENVCDRKKTNNKMIREKKTKNKQT